MYENGRVALDVKTAKSKTEVWDNRVKKEYWIFECKVVECVSRTWQPIKKQWLRKNVKITAKVRDRQNKECFSKIRRRQISLEENEWGKNCIPARVS